MKLTMSQCRAAQRSAALIQAWGDAVDDWQIAGMLE